MDTGGYRPKSAALPPKFRSTTPESAASAAGGLGNAGATELSNEGSGERPWAESRALGRLKMLTGLLIVNGSEPI